METTDPTAHPDATTGEAGITARPPTRLARGARIAAPIVAAALLGGGVVYAVDRNSGSSAHAGNAATVFGDPNGGGRQGGLAGEQHIQGTVTAKTGSTVTIETGSTTATYTVGATTEIVRNGRPSTLAAIRVGDPVFAHVYPSSTGQMLVERLFAGTSTGNGGPDGFGPPPGSGGIGAGSGATHI